MAVPESIRNKVEQSLGYMMDHPRLGDAFFFFLAVSSIPFLALGYVCSRFSGKE